MAREVLEVATERAGTSDDRSKRKILLVDDSNTALMVERLLLGGSDYDIATARDGREAVEKAAVEHPDLILMDVMMPNMTGIEACRALRAMPSTREIPIILVTTRGEPENVGRGLASGRNDYITKPIDGAELLAKVHPYVGSR